MIVVPDGGPLIYLAGAGQLELLRQLYDRVVVPRVVFDEVVVAGAGLTGSREVAASTWLVGEGVAPDPDLSATMDRGDAAAIPLAERLGATLLCHDAAGRAEARRRRLQVVGRLGVRLLAKNRGLLSQVRPIIEAMRGAGMYVATGLLSQILVPAEEDDTHA